MLFQLALLCACVAVSGACSCWSRPFPDAFCGYNIVFRGEVVAEKIEPEPTDPTDFLSYQSAQRIYTVLVNQTFTMPSSVSRNQTIAMKTPTIDTLCGVHFAQNTDTVFAGMLRDDGEVWTVLCAPNVPWERLSQQLQTLLGNDGLAVYCANTKITHR